ncbi:MAG: VPLPA-CTERM sorting domain-containing protein [Desulfobaccales bacterium]
METSELGSTFTGTAIGPVPVPAPVFLLGTGLLALAWFRRKKPSGI